MQEDFNNTQKNSAESETTTRKMSAREWIENFWYHYKWQSLIALFLVFTITVCSLQMCQKESYDVHIMYVGGHEIDRKGSTGGTPEYQTITSSLTRVCRDFDENGTISVNFYDLFLLTDEEISNLKLDAGYEINYSLLNENEEIFAQNISISDYYVCFLSRAVYDEYRNINGVDVFAPLAPYVNEGTAVEFYTDSAIYLSSTGFKLMPGIKNLPDDTVICLRKISLLSSHFNGSKNEKMYKQAEEVIEEIINFEPIG